MGSGAGAGRGAVDETFKLICIAAYAAYVLIGLAVAVVGVVYWSSTLIASGMVSALLILSGLGMVGVGAAAIYGLVNNDALVLGVVWCVRVARDPVARAACNARNVVARSALLSTTL